VLSKTSHPNEQYRTLLQKFKLAKNDILVSNKRKKKLSMQSHHIIILHNQYIIRHMQHYHVFRIITSSYSLPRSFARYCQNHSKP